MITYCLTVAENLEQAKSYVASYLNQEGFTTCGKFAYGPAAGGYSFVARDCRELTKDDWDHIESLLDYEGNSWYNQYVEGQELPDYCCLYSDLDGAPIVISTNDLPIEDYEDRIGQYGCNYPYLVVVEY